MAHMFGKCMEFHLTSIVCYVSW